MFLECALPFGRPPEWLADDIRSATLNGLLSQVDPQSAHPLL